MTDNEIITALRDWGCDTHAALERTLHDAAFYVDCLTLFHDDAHFQRLGEAIEAGNARAAFENAHALKGVAGNLGLTPLYRAICAIVEPLRDGQLKDADRLYRDVMGQYEIFSFCMLRPESDDSPRG